jgi:hypothetical protein
MPDRRCTNCNRNCLGHFGPTGSKCSLLPIVESDLNITESSTEIHVIGHMATVNKAVEDRFASLSDQLDLLVTSVETLSREVVKSCATRQEPLPDAGAGLNDSGIGARPKEPTGETPRPDGTVKEGDGDRKQTTQSLAPDRDLSRLLEEYNDGGVSELLFMQDSVNKSARRLNSVEKSQKFLLIPDFVSHLLGSCEEEEDSFVTTRGKS